MRRLSVLFLFATVMVAMPSQAQLVKFGLKGGVNLTKMELSNENLDASNRAGFFVGPTVIVNLPLTGFDIDASALYDYRESKLDKVYVSYLLHDAEDETLNATIKQQQIAIPINLRYGIGIGSVARVFAFAGPQFAFAVGNKSQSLYHGINEWKLKNSNFSVNVGVGATVLKHLQATVNYNIAYGRSGEITYKHALHRTDEYVSKGKSNSWQIGVAYIF